MNIDFTPFFEKYETLVKAADDAFKKVSSEFNDCVTCEIKCSDCCHAIFDLTLIEAIYLKNKFNEKFSGEEKARLIENADKIDRQLALLKKEAYKQSKDGVDEVEILGKISMERMRCPLLDDNDECILYENRPLTCRIYGIPTSTLGKSHICGKTGFEQGKPYPTLNMDNLYKRLYMISQELVVQIKSEFVQMADILVPVSFAITNDFTSDYLGVKSETKKKEQDEV